MHGTYTKVHEYYFLQTASLHVKATLWPPPSIWHERKVSVMTAFAGLLSNIVLAEVRTLG